MISEIEQNNDDSNLITYPDTIGRSAVFLQVFSVVCFVAMALIYSRSFESVASYFLLIFFAVMIKCNSRNLPGYGYLNSNLFVYLATLLLGYAFYANKLEDGAMMSIYSCAVTVAFVAETLGWAYYILALRDKKSWWIRTANYCINIVNVAMISLIVLNIPPRYTNNAIINGSIISELSPFTLMGISTLIVSILIIWGSNEVIYKQMLLHIEGKKSCRSWMIIHNKIGLYSAIVHVLTAYVIVALIIEFWSQSEGIDVSLSVLGGLLLGLMPVWLVGRLARSFTMEKVNDNVDLLAAKLRGAQIQIDTLKAREQNLQGEVLKRAGNLEILFGMVRDLGAATTSDEVCDILTRILNGLGINYQSFVVFILQDDVQIPIKMITPYKEVLNMAHLLQLEEPIVSKALKTKRVQMANEEPGNSSIREEGEQRIFKDEYSTICAPLIVNQSPIGAFYLGSPQSGTYSEDTKAQMASVAACAAPSIHIVRLYESKDRDLENERRIRTQVEAQKTQLEGLQNMVQGMGRELTIDHTLNVVMNSVSELLPSAQSVIVMLDSVIVSPDKEHSGPQTFDPVMYETPFRNIVKELHIVNGEGFMGLVMQCRSRIAVSNFKEYSHRNIIPLELSAIGVPLITEDEVLGGLYVGSSRKDAFEEAEINIIQTIASQASLAIKNAILMEQTRQQALTDGLTGLFTHRFFKEQLKLIIDDAKRTKLPACLIVIDCDNFKNYNDTLGHPAGDKLLQEVAAILTGAVRKNDVVCRQGGDEFSIIMKECSKENGIATAKNIRSTVENSFKERKVKITASLGVSCYPNDADDVNNFQIRADEALYESKKSGRNRVCWV